MLHTRVTRIQSFKTSLRQIRPADVFSLLTVALLLGLLEVIVNVAFAALVFSGDLSANRADAIGMFLLGGVVMATSMALFSSFPGLIAGPQDVTAALLAVVAAAVVTNMPDSASSQETFLTVMACIVLASFLAGLFFFVLGQFKLGNMIRFIPYPVIGGFLGGTGLILIRGAIGMMAAPPVGESEFKVLVDSDLLVKWLPGLVLALVLLVISRRWSHFLIVPGMLLGGIIVFYTALVLTGTSVTEATDHGWLISGLPSGGLWHTLDFTEVDQVQWDIVGGQATGLLAIAVVGAITLLLNGSGIELATRQDLNLNRELKASGVSNLLAGLAGGIVGTHVLSLTILAHRLGVRRRLLGLLVAGIGALVLLAGGKVLSYFPNPVLGGLLLFLGLDFLVTWVYDAWFKLSKMDYLIVLLILAATNVIGFLEGVGVGILLAALLFIVTYSRVDVVKYALSGGERRSNVVRPRLYQELLHSKGQWLYILKLQGYIFFGTANSLLEQVRQRINGPETTPPHYILFDFSLVTGLDSSAALSFTKMLQLAQSHQIVLVFTGLSPHIHNCLAREISDEQFAAHWCVFPDLDHGIEWCEDQTIAVFESVGLAARPKTLKQQLEDSLSDPDQLAALMRYFERQDIQAGDYLIRQGDAAQGMYFIEQGQVTVQLENEKGVVFRLRKMGQGTLVGELGTYLSQPATASVVADQASVIYRLSTEALHKMEQEEPESAAVFHRFMAYFLAERLTQTTETLSALAT